MDKNYQASLKSAETEDWVDYHIIRPFCYHLSKWFARLDIHPNSVTIASMFVGAGSSFFFAQGCYYYEGWCGLVCNLVAILMLMVADIFDCTDGQLARMTGKKSRMGRILDGLAGFTWAVPIYCALTYRFYVHHDIEFSWLGLSDTPQTALIATAVVFVLALISGFVGQAGQQRLADYYIQVHLFFMKGEKGSELDNSVRQQEIYDTMPADAKWIERAFQKSYIDYTRQQEKSTPEFQRLMRVLRQRYGSSDQIPQSVRDEFRRESLPLIKWNGLLTFNFRTAWLFLFCLLDVPVLNFLFEIIAMSILACYVNRRHERFSRRIADQVEATHQA